MRNLILSEIRRLTGEAGGKPPGAQAFENATGISEAKWRGVVWARWGDALEEAGFERNVLQARFPDEVLLSLLVQLTRALGRVPTRAEIKLQRNHDVNFPSLGAFSRRFPTNDQLLQGLRRYAQTNGLYDVENLLPSESAPSLPRPIATAVEGVVYLLKSGAHFKIGRSDELERRVKEIRVALPEAVTFVHSIRTDDPSGIESYWHRRFSARRANGEWFALMPEDVKAFCRRNFQ